jgi:symplekin
MASRIHLHVERLIRSRTEIFEEATRKRGPPDPVDVMDSTKRQRLSAEVTSAPSSRLFIPPLTRGSHTVGELFTLSTDEGLKKFDVASLDEDLVIRIAATILSTVDTNTLNQAINV